MCLAVCSCLPKSLRMLFIPLCLAVVVFCAPVPSKITREFVGSRQILLQAGTLDTTKPRAHSLSDEALRQHLEHDASQQTSDFYQWIVHVKGPISRQMRAMLNDYLAPFELGQYVPDHSFIVVCIQLYLFSLWILPPHVFPMYACVCMVCS